jgi:phosphoribosylaminoimidazolecarboxamide formyltransferase/IMP cyclohydrolase
MPAQVSVNLEKYQDLRYGENPHSASAWYKPPTISTDLCKNFPPFEQLQGKELSFNNIVDVYALLRILRDLPGSGACIIKHNNPCGVALDKDVFKAFEKAYDCDPISAFGGIYGFTAAVDGKLAERVTRDFIEIVMAPSFDKDALAALAKKKNVRVLKVKPEVLEKKRSIRDGICCRKGYGGTGHSRQVQVRDRGEARQGLSPGRRVRMVSN